MFGSRLTLSPLGKPLDCEWRTVDPVGSYIKCFKSLMKMPLACEGVLYLQPDDIEQE